MSGEMGEYRSYDHLRVNVRRRRMAYKVFLWVALLVFLVSIADIIWLDEVLFWGVVAAYVVLFVWAIILLIAVPLGEEAEVLRKLALGEAALHCPNCQSVFFYAADHTDDPKGTALTCPVCGIDSRLPAAHSEADPVTMPKGGKHKQGYQCDNCDEHVLITTVGKAPRAVRFEACPHCQHTGTMRAAEIPAGAKVREIRDWTTA